MSVANQEVERKIADALITEALKAGYTFGLYTTNDLETEEKFSDKESLLAQMFGVDDERLYFYKDGKRAGWVWFVYGNDGWDVICDYTPTLEHVMTQAHKLEEHYGDL